MKRIFGSLNLPAISDILVVSGGQCGADLGGLLAAEMLGVETGGIAPLGYRTEKGKQPILKTRFNLTEHSSWQYPPRTEENVKLSDVTLIAVSYTHLTLPTIYSV